MIKRNFWPLDFDPEGEVYENVAWDLPGYTYRREELKQPRKARARSRSQRKELRYKTR